MVVAPAPREKFRASRGQQETMLWVVVACLLVVAVVALMYTGASAWSNRMRAERHLEGLHRRCAIGSGRITGLMVVLPPGQGRAGLRSVVSAVVRARCYRNLRVFIVDYRTPREQGGETARSWLRRHLQRVHAQDVKIAIQTLPPEQYRGTVPAIQFAKLAEMDFVAAIGTGVHFEPEWEYRAEEDIAEAARLAESGKVVLSVCEEGNSRRVSPSKALSPHGWFARSAILKSLGRGADHGFAQQLHAAGWSAWCAARPLAH